MIIDLDTQRRNTPGCRPNNPESDPRAPSAHFLHCGASQMPQRTLDVVKDHLDLEAQIGGYGAEEAARDRIGEVYRSVGRLIGADPSEIALVENATVAWRQAFYGIATSLREGDRVLTVSGDYASNHIALLQATRERGASLEVIPDGPDGATDPEALRQLMDDRVRLIAITHVPTGTGLVNPVLEIGRVAANFPNALYLLDACQSAGQMPLDVSSIGCDFLSATSRKFLRGPRGVGFLYARQKTTSQIDPPMLDLHSAEWTSSDRFEIRPDARRFENWESDVAARLGLGAAVELALEIGVDQIWSRILLLADRLRERLGRIREVTLCDAEGAQCGILSFIHEQHTPEEIRDLLDRRGFRVGTSTIASTRLWFEARGLKSVVRAAVHYINTEDEVDRLAAAIAEL